MKIALDFDETYTQDPDGWDKFIEMMMLRGHEIMVVTFRDPGLPVERIPFQKGGGIDVHYCSYKGKRRTMESRGIEIDVWIDDSPDTIVADSGWTEEQRKDWLEEHLSKQRVVNV